MNKFVVFPVLFILFFVYAETDSTLDILEKNLSKVRTVQADFIQEKSLAIFNEKLIIKGSIYLEKPNLFSWQVQEPLAYSLVVKKGRILQWDAESGQIQKIYLEDKPVFQTIISQMQKWFYGQYNQVLEDYYMNKLKSLPPILEFIPKESSPTVNIIEKIVVYFREDCKYIKKIKIKEKSGDETILKFINIRLNEPIKSSAWEVGS